METITLTTEIINSMKQMISAVLNGTSIVNEWFTRSDFDEDYDFDEIQINREKHGDNNDIITIYIKYDEIISFKIEDYLILDYFVDKVYPLSSCCSSIYVYTNSTLCYNCFKEQYENDEKCAICLENIGKWAKLPCEHKFHGQCIRKIHSHENSNGKWYYRCPICRQRFNSFICIDNINLDSQDEEFNFINYYYGNGYYDNNFYIKDDIRLSSKDDPFIELLKKFFYYEFDNDSNPAMFKDGKTYGF